MLSITDFTCTVQDKLICSGASLQSRPGQVTVLLGASGSGKTRLLKGITGLTNELTGSFSWQGELVTSPLYHVIHMGMLFQNNALLDGLTVGENLRLAAPVNDRELADDLNRLGLAELGARYPGELSEGMKRRIALLRAGLGKPDLICLDEPLAGLDATAREQVIQLVVRWQQAGSCIILSTHLLTGLDQLTACYYAIAGGVLLGEYADVAAVKRAVPGLLRESDEI
ncbi:MAG: ABC transporter ATP-binding protein [Candidatus Delongbacteria bacterium]|nr:ABC transporter ATP-binding protein [Candidatus Delongbacteria bacterium]